jgi:hypothetical protein
LYAVEKQLTVKTDGSMMCFLDVLVYDRSGQLAIACLIDGNGRFIQTNQGEGNQALVDRVIARLID